MLPEIDSNYSGFCCPNFDYKICLIFEDKKNIGRSTIYGVCQNPDCPVNPDSHWRGVSDCDLDDFMDTLEEKGIKDAKN